MKGLEKDMQMQLRAVASGGAGGARPTHLKSVRPASYSAPDCCIHPLLYLRMWPPCDFCPPCCEILATGLMQLTPF